MYGLRSRRSTAASTGARSYRFFREAASLRTREPSMLTPSAIAVPGFAVRAFATAVFAYAITPSPDGDTSTRCIPAVRMSAELNAARTTAYAARGRKSVVMGKRVEPGGGGRAEEQLRE